MMLCFVALGFFGCAKINAGTISNDDGSIDEIVTITLDQQQFVDAGYNYLLVKTDIADMAIKIVTQIRCNFDYKADSSIKTRINTGKLTITPNTGVWEGDTFRIGLHFLDVQAYRFYYNIDEDAAAEPTVESHFFYDKIIVKGSTIYASYHTLYDELSAYYTKKYPILAEQENEFYFTYVLNYRRQKSDADSVEKVDGKYYHTWKLNAGETDKVITIYYYLANRGNCILVCLIASLAVCAILISVGIVISKNKKKKQQNTN